MIYLVGCQADDYMGVKKTIDGHRSTLSIYDDAQPQFGLSSQGTAILLVAFRGTTDELKQAIGFGGSHGEGDLSPLNGFVFHISGYAGYWPKSLWDWCQVYSSDT